MKCIEKIDAPEVGIYLSHRYTKAGLASYHLKSIDRIIVDTIKHQWPRSTLLPVINHLHKYIEDDNYGPSDESDAKNAVYSFTLYDLNLEGSISKPTITFEHSDNIPFFYITYEGAELEKIEKESSYTGNSTDPGEEESLYYHCAIIAVKQK